MTDKKLSIKLILKVGDDLNSYADRHVVIYRGQGPWTNPDSWSLPGVDGSGENALVDGARDKFGLDTQLDDWTKLAEVENPANNEVNHVWRYDKPIEQKDLTAFFNHVANVNVMSLGALWEDYAQNKKTLSPALETILQAARKEDDESEFNQLFEPS